MTHVYMSNGEQRLSGMKEIT